MAWTARTEDETQEFFDPPEKLDRKVSQLAEWVRSSKHTIVFTVSEATVMVSAPILLVLIAASQTLARVLGSGQVSP